VIRILIVDDHPAVRAGLLAVLRGEPGLIPVGNAGTAKEALELAARWAPDVVLVDYQLPDANGAVLALELKQLDAPPRVVIYSAFAEPRLSLAAALSGAEAVLDKNCSIEAIFETVRAVAGGKCLIQPSALRAVRDAAWFVDPQEQAIFGLAVAGEPATDIARVLRMDEQVVSRRIRTMVEKLGPRLAGYSPVEATD
jgi:DNA-binding NarL/FixJ family response regulator